MKWILPLFFVASLALTITVEPGETLIATGFSDINCEISGVHMGNMYILHNTSNNPVSCEITPGEEGGAWKNATEWIMEAVKNRTKSRVVTGESVLIVDATSPGKIKFKGKNGKVEVKVGINKKTARSASDLNLWGDYYIVETDPVIVWLIKKGKTAGFSVESGSIELTEFSVRLAGCDMSLAVYSPQEGERFPVYKELAAVPVKFSVLVGGEKVYTPDVSVYLDSSPVDVEYDPATEEYSGVANGGEGAHSIKIEARVGECSATKEVSVYIEKGSSIPENPWVMACSVLLLLSGVSLLSRAS